MNFLLIFLSIALTIIKANGWIMVPTFCVVLSWATGIVTWFNYLMTRYSGNDANLK